MNLYGRVREAAKSNKKAKRLMLKLDVVNNRIAIEDDPLEKSVLLETEEVLLGKKAFMHGE